MTDNEIYLFNLQILRQLCDIDGKSVRALRTNDSDKLQELEEQAIALRAQLLPVS